MVLNGLTDRHDIFKMDLNAVRESLNTYTWKQDPIYWASDVRRKIEREYPSSDLLLIRG